MKYINHFIFLTFSAILCMTFVIAFEIFSEGKHLQVERYDSELFLLRNIDWFFINENEEINYFSDISESKKSHNIHGLVVGLYAIRYIQIANEGGDAEWVDFVKESREIEKLIISDLENENISSFDKRIKNIRNLISNYSSYSDEYFAKVSDEADMFGSGTTTKIVILIFLLHLLVFIYSTNIEVALEKSKKISRERLIFICALFSVLGVTADQLAYHVDDQLESLYDRVNYFSDELGIVSLNMNEVSETIRRVEYLIETDQQPKDFKVNLLDYLDESWLREDREWYDADMYDGLPFQPTEERISGLFDYYDNLDHANISLSEVHEALKFLNILEIVYGFNLDLEIWYDYSKIHKFNVARQTFLLTSMLSSLICLLAILVYAKKNSK